MRGREPCGLLGPHAEAIEEATDLLITALLDLRNDDTGEPAVGEVLRTDDLHRGPRRDWLPDLLVVWDWSAPITSLSSPLIGSITGKAVHVRTGDHRPPGLVLTRGLTLDDARPLPVENLAKALVSAVRDQ